MSRVAVDRQETIRRITIANTGCAEVIERACGTLGISSVGVISRARAAVHAKTSVLERRSLSDPELEELLAAVWEQNVMSRALDDVAALLADEFQRLRNTPAPPKAAANANAWRVN